MHTTKKSLVSETAFLTPIFFLLYTIKQSRLTVTSKIHLVQPHGKRKANEIICSLETSSNEDSFMSLKWLFQGMSSYKNFINFISCVKKKPLFGATCSHHSLSSPRRLHQLCICLLSTGKPWQGIPRKSKPNIFLIVQVTSLLCSCILKFKICFVLSNLILNLHLQNLSHMMLPKTNIHWLLVPMLFKDSFLCHCTP